MADSDDGSSESIDGLNRTAWEIGLHEPERSRELADRALELARRYGYARGEALALRTIGYQHLLKGDYERAHALSLEAADKLHELDDAGGEASALLSLGMIYQMLSDYEKALRYGLECRRLYQKVSDARGEAWALVEIGNVHKSVHELDRARERYEEARALFESIDYAPGLGRVLTLLGGLASSRGDEEEAESHHRRSIALAEESGLSLSMLPSVSALGRLYQKRGDRARAREYLERALDLAGRTELAELKASARLSLARLELEEDTLERAEALLLEGLRLVQGTLGKETESGIHECLSALFERKGDHERALEHHKSFHRLRDEMFDEAGRARLNELQIRLSVERAEREAEVQRLRYVELAGMQAELVQSEKLAMLGRLVAGLSHELNTPIGVIRSNAELAERAIGILREAGLLEAGGKRAERALSTLEQTQAASAAAGKRLSELLESLRAYARLDEASVQRADISECLRETLQLFRTQLPPTIELETELSPLPETACRPGELNQVFMTILVNASEAVEGRGRLRVFCAPENGFARIEIQDDGKGIPPDRIDELFEIDFRRKRSQVRLRMGLSAAKGIVEKHGGRIEVESRPGEGTTFRIRIPLKPRAVPHFGGGYKSVSNEA